MWRNKKNNTERKLVILIIFLAVLLSSIPMMSALSEGARHGLIWRGNNLLAPGDFGVYLSYISQSQSGRLFFDNLFDTGGHQPTLHGLWLMTGWLAAIFRLTPMLAFHVMRLLLIPILGWVSWRWIKEILPTSKQRLTALILTLFGGGIGFFFQSLYQIGELNPLNPARPVDLWVSESFPFLSSLNSPHFIAAWILLLLALHQIWKALRNRSLVSAIWAGLAGTLLLTFHPFHLVTLVLVPFIWFMLKAIFGQIKQKDWLIGIIYLAILSPFAVYHAYNSRIGPDAVMLSVRSLAITPNPWHIFLGFGLLLPLAALGWHVAKKQGIKNLDRLWLLAWILIQPFAFYGPFVFQRRLLLGWLFPLAILSAPAIVYILQRYRNRNNSPIKTVAFFMMASIALFNIVPGTIVSAIATFESPDHRSAFYLYPNRLQAIGWIKKNTPSDSVFLAWPTAGYDIAGWGNRTVLAGHWANTNRLLEKQELILDFFNSMSLIERRKIIKEFGITHVWFGPEEHAISDFSDWKSISEKIFETKNYKIFRLKIP